MGIQFQPKSEAPGQLLGYSLQTTRAVYYLLIAVEGDSVSVENLDDILIQNHDGTFICEQDKSITSEANPISDHAVDFWKAFYNWLILIENGSLRIDNTQFILYLSCLRQGNIAERFSSANSYDEAKNAYEYAKIQILGSSGFSILSSAIQPYAQKIFSAEQDLVINLIQHFTLEFSQNNPIDDLKPLISKQWVPEESYDILLTYLLGWVKQNIDFKLGKKQKAILSFKDFKKETISLTKKINYRNIIIDLAGKPSTDTLMAELQQCKTYVRQLQIIDLSESEILLAIEYYLRSSSQRTELGRRGFVNETSFDDYEQRLIHEWHYSKMQCSNANSNFTDTTKGKLLYSECMQKHIPLENMEVPFYFTPGSYHMLADSKKLGWHEHYLSLMP